MALREAVFGIGAVTSSPGASAAGVSAGVGKA
jgi:hypothetical protein